MLRVSDDRSIDYHILKIWHVVIMSALDVVNGRSYRLIQQGRTFST